MAISNIADLIVASLEQAGVKRIFGIVGDSLNGFTEALRRVRTERLFAADAVG
jgi:pyruvate dehydrogenase (quinone)